MYKFIFECYDEFYDTEAAPHPYRNPTKIIIRKYNSIKIKIIAIDEKSAKEQLNKIKGVREYTKIIEIEEMKKSTIPTAPKGMEFGI